MRLTTTALALFLLTAALGPQALDGQTLRIGYIDSQAILQEAPGAQEAQREFEQDMERYQAEIQGMEQDLEQLIDQYRQQQSVLSAEAREAREAEIRQREQEFGRRVDEMEAEFAQRRQELVEPILSRMSETIEAIRSEGNYTMIFDAAGQSIIAADPELDLTDEVIRRLRENASGGGDDR